MKEKMFARLMDVYSRTDLEDVHDRAYLLGITHGFAESVCYAYCNDTISQDEYLAIVKKCDEICNEILDWNNVLTSN